MSETCRVTVVRPAVTRVRIGARGAVRVQRARPGVSVSSGAARVTEVNEHETVVMHAPRGPAGPAGPAGSDAGGTFTHVQNAPAAVWTIAHNLGFRPAGVYVRDTSDSEIDGIVNHVDADSLTVTFSAAFSGEAYLS